MILVDTSVWIDHLRQTDARLVELLNDGDVLTHPFVIEELACGSLPKRNEFLELISALPFAPLAEHEEVLDLIANERLYSTGLGSVDVHLIASAMLGNAEILTRDKTLARETERLGILAS